MVIKALFSLLLCLIYLYIDHESQMTQTLLEMLSDSSFAGGTKLCSQARLIFLVTPTGGPDLH
jgi:hypothetical protein